MSRRDDQLVDDAAEVAALLEQPDDAEDAQLVDELGDVPDDDSPTPTREQVRVAALLCAHATSGTDLDDLAGVLGVRHAVELAERWLNALSRAAAEPPRPPMTSALLEHLVPVVLDDVEPIEDDDQPIEEEHDHDEACDRCGTPAGICCGHCSGAMAERLAVEQLDESEAEIEAFEERERQAAMSAGPQPCEVCGLNVTAQKIAETGRARHPWHPED